MRFNLNLQLRHNNTPLAIYLIHPLNRLNIITSRYHQ